MPTFLRFFVLLVPLTGIYVFWFSSGWWYFLVAGIYLVGIPLLESLSLYSYRYFGKKWNRLFVYNQKALSTGLANLLLWTCTFLYLALLAVFFYKLHDSSHWAERIGLALGVGIISGAQGITMAHEHGHRTHWTSILASYLMLFMNFIPHYRIEHNYGHHRDVGLPSDPSSAPKGQSLYRSLLRWYPMTIKKAHRIAQSLHGGTSPFRNVVLWFYFAMLGLVVTSFLFLGWNTLFWLAAGVIGIALLVSSNYIEHYGLTRSPSTPSTHIGLSWNSNFYLERILLFELVYHSHHHQQPQQPWEALALKEKAPMLPGGYGYMIFLAYFPGLWFKKIDPLLTHGSV